MKKFLIFALCSVATIVLIHLILKLFNVEEASIAADIVPIFIIYCCFYGMNIPFSKTKGKE